jgi:ATP-dependent Clp protease adaptor protein ClpS
MDIKEGKTLKEILDESNISFNMESSKLILWNDDINSFQLVIYCLIVYLGFTPEKAESTAYTVHIKGKEIIKTGSIEELNPYKKILEKRGLSVTIE